MRRLDLSVLHDRFMRLYSERQWGPRVLGVCLQRRRALALLFALSWAGGDGIMAAELPDPLRVEDVPRIAREQRAEVAAARARARAADQRPAIVSALEDPMISPAIDHYPYEMMKEEGGSGRRYDWSVTVEQRFPLSGIRGHRRRSAQAEAARLWADTDRTALDVELDAMTAFLMLYERRRMVEVVDQQLALAHQFVTAAAARYAAAVGNQADVLRAEVEVARLDAARQALAAEVRAAEAMLNAGLGRPVDASVPQLARPITDAAPPPWETVHAQALQRRPELHAGEAEIEQARAEVDVMRAMYLPMGMVRGGQASTMAEGRGGMLMVGVSIPIWRERLRAGLGEARAMEDMARADWQAMRRMIEGEAAAARNQVEAARTRFVAFRDEVVPRAQSAVTPALANYAAGQGSLAAVIDAAQALWSAQGELVMAETNLGLAWARLQRTTGEWGREAPSKLMIPPDPILLPPLESNPSRDNDDSEEEES